MAPTLNQDDIKLLKQIFPTKSDLKTEILQSEKRIVKLMDEKIKRSERKIIKRVDLVDKALDREHMKLVREVDQIKIHVGLPIQPI